MALNSWYKFNSSGVKILLLVSENNSQLSGKVFLENPDEPAIGPLSFNELAVLVFWTMQAYVKWPWPSPLVQWL